MTMRSKRARSIKQIYESVVRFLSLSGLVFDGSKHDFNNCDLFRDHSFLLVVML